MVRDTCGSKAYSANLRFIYDVIKFKMKDFRFGKVQVGLMQNNLVLSYFEVFGFFEVRFV